MFLDVCGWHDGFAHVPWDCGGASGAGDARVCKRVMSYKAVLLPNVSTWLTTRLDVHGGSRSVIFPLVGEDLTMSSRPRLQIANTPHYVARKVANLTRQNRQTKDNDRNHSRKEKNTKKTLSP